MIICAYCKSHVFVTDRKCPACGSKTFIPLQVTEPKEPLQEQASPWEGKAPHGHEPTAVYQTIHKTIYVKEQKSTRRRWIALVLCLLGGYLGIHRFYAGKYGTGFLYLITGGMFLLGTLADFFSILFGYFRDKEGQLLS